MQAEIILLLLLSLVGFMTSPWSLTKADSKFNSFGVIKGQLFVGSASYNLH